MQSGLDQLVDRAIPTDDAVFSVDVQLIFFCGQCLSTTNDITTHRVVNNEKNSKKKKSKSNAPTGFTSFFNENKKWFRVTWKSSDNSVGDSCPG